MREEQSLDSGSSRMEESSVRTVLEKLCQELNMDEQTATEAMQNFTAIWATHTLEGDVVHWLACSLYAACRKGSTPTVGKGLMEGNCVSLTRILRTSKLSLIQFFSKMRKWADMSNLSQNFRLRLKQLERNFEVSMVIFRKRLPCHITDVFKFCWTLFVYAKGNFCMIGDDLVNSYHLLLCCLDLVFGNALLCSNRKELINPSFKGLPAAYHADGRAAPQRPPCVLERLCELHDGLVVEAKGIKQHYFKPYIQKLFEKQILKGNEEHLTELLDPQNFIENNKALNKEYEEYVLTVGDFDERVFLGADADEEIGTPRKIVRDSSSCQKNVEKPASLLPSTPLTGHAYLKENKVLGTPISLATQSVSRLQSMVAGLRTAPSENLMQIFKSCSRDPTESILARVKTLGKTFKEHYALDSEDMPTSHIDFAEKRLKLAEILYYKVLENVMVQEMKRLHGKDMSILLEQDIFHCSLMACCLEVVLFSYSSQRTFPWIINIFKLASFYFFKVQVLRLAFTQSANCETSIVSVNLQVIEVFIRSEEGLSRDMVKHLNQIEEQVLESQAWSTDSALWSALQAAGSQVPTVEEVRRSTVKAAGCQSPLPLVTLSPIIHPRIREFRSGLGSTRKDVPPSPLSVHDRYSSPVAGSAKRRLFGDDHPSPGIPHGLTLISPAKRLMIGPSSTLKISAPGSQAALTVPLQIQPCDSSGTINAQFLLTTSLGPAVALDPAPPDAQAGSRPQAHRVTCSVFQEGKSRTSVCKDHKLQPKPSPRALCLCLQVYHLASVRLRDLCWKLDISSDLRGKIWTCFEHTLIHCTDLMRGRHLDQLLLCSVYIMSKITKETHFFHDIMKCYRSQPQAHSHVYRNVLLRHRECVAEENMEVDPASVADSAEKTSQTSGDANVSQPGEEERGDLIQFYNSVFVLKVKNFALRYAVSDSEELTAINRIIQQGCVSRKRVFTIEGDVLSSASYSPTKRACSQSSSSPDVLLKRLQDVVSERQSH
ncbi:hypothetical protein fugu_005463 [Takifugu bimaculatus]|uniref:Retinoblastoma-like protein 1 n=1 Tax=Takifugu bimaculatus TaxID=433685 RepID=A0A4Z2BC28_9TELE|nr:hypothetical protein fugu_005463 [Takifugu bimaculatus]